MGGNPDLSELSHSGSNDSVSETEHNDGNEQIEATIHPPEDSVQAPVSTPYEAYSSGEDDEEINFRVAAFAEIEKIRQSNLSIALQGLRTKRRLKRPQENVDDDSQSSAKSFDNVLPVESSAPEAIVFEGRIFQKGRCYSIMKMSEHLAWM